MPRALSLSVSLAFGLVALGCEAVPTLSFPADAGSSEAGHDGGSDGGEVDGGTCLLSGNAFKCCGTIACGGSSCSEFACESCVTECAGLTGPGSSPVCCGKDNGRPNCHPAGYNCP